MVVRHRSSGLATWALGVALALLLASTTQARWLPSFHARATAEEPQRAGGMPTDAELERQGARIGAIRVHARDLFDVNRSDEDAALSRLANRLHYETREQVIVGQLLFKSGDPYRAAVLAESARLLRNTRYLGDASVRPVAYRDGVVDVEVVTQDVWTFTPGVSFGRRGGANSRGFEIEDLNFLGRGTQLALGMKSGVDRDSKYISYRDRQLGDSHWDLDTTYSDNSDGRYTRFALERPFYSLDTRWSAGFAISDDRRVDARYDLGKIGDRYGVHATLASLYVGRSAGLVDDWVRRTSFGLTLDNRVFDVAPGARGTVLLPTDRQFAYPWFAVEWLQDDFRTVRNRDQIQKTEDYAFGWHVRAQVGLAARGIGSRGDAWLVNGSLAKGFELGERQSVFFDLDARSRIESGGLSDATLSGSARYYFRESHRGLLFLNVDVEAGRNLDVDHQVLLGGDNGLRGYPLRYQAGDGRWLVTAEQRFFTDWYPFRLFNVGAAVFYDMGASWGRDPLGAPSAGLLRDVGFGLRLGNSRTALGSVLHLDVAFPLDGASDARSVQFLIATKKTF